MGHPMRLELTRVGLLVKLANRYTTKGALSCFVVVQDQKYRALSQDILT